MGNSYFPAGAGVACNPTSLSVIAGGRRRTADLLILLRVKVVFQSAIPHRRRRAESQRKHLCRLGALFTNQQ